MKCPDLLKLNGEEKKADGSSWYGKKHDIVLEVVLVSNVVMLSMKTQHTALLKSSQPEKIHVVKIGI